VGQCGGARAGACKPDQERDHVHAKKRQWVRKYIAPPDYQGSVAFSFLTTAWASIKSDLAHVFEPFYRADLSRVRNVKTTGSGLGLSIVNEIVRMHHGKINIESAHKKGTTVSVVLPIASTKQIAPEIKKSPRNHLSVDFSNNLANIFQK
jgi:hypothetical protein